MVNLVERNSHKNTSNLEIDQVHSSESGIERAIKNNSSNNNNNNNNNNNKTNITLRTDKSRKNIKYYYFHFYFKKVDFGKLYVY